MKAIYVSEFGGPEAPRLEGMPDPRPPQYGEVLVSVNPAGVTEKSYAQKMRDWQQALATRVAKTTATLQCADNSGIANDGRGSASAQRQPSADRRYCPGVGTEQK
jgi:hypothetical protein